MYLLINVKAEKIPNINIKKNNTITSKSHEHTPSGGARDRQGRVRHFQVGP
jgi:hypothetical protein